MLEHFYTALQLRPTLVVINYLFQIIFSGNKEKIKTQSENHICI